MGTHVVEKQSGKLYISKQMVKTCLSKPISIKQRSVEFVSIPWPSVQARSLERRAPSGMALHQELSSLPTVFRKVEFEPVACRSEASSISLNCISKLSLPQVEINLELYHWLNQ